MNITTSAAEGWTGKAGRHEGTLLVYQKLPLALFDLRRFVFLLAINIDWQRRA